jgi:hypothetical protein
MQSIIEYFNKPILKVSLVFGSITGLLAFVFFLSLYWMGIVPLGNHKVFDIGIHMILIAGACWFYRKNVGNGFLHLWEALTIGYVVNCVGALINGWLIYLFITFIDPEIFTKYTAEMISLLNGGKAQLVKDLTEAEFLKMYKEVQSMQPSVVIKDEVSKKMLMGIIPILVISLILRRQDYGVFHKKE